MQGNPPSYFIWNGWVPQLFNPAVPYCRTPWFVMWHLLHYTPSLTMYSPHLQRISFCHFLPAANLFILSKHVFASPALSYSFFHFVSLFHLWPFLFIGSLIFLPLTLLSAELCTSKLLHLASFPCLTFIICFFALASGSLKNIQNLSFLSASGLCVLPFLSVYVSLPYRSSSLSVCQVLLNPCQSGGIHR